MRYKVLLWVLLVWIAGDAYAQANEQVFRVNFKSDEFVLDASDYAVLDEVLLRVKNLPYTEVEVKAHTDKDASDAYNVRLSQRRAESVKAYLIKNGIGENRMQVQAFGEKKPIDINSTVTGKAANRRVDITLHIYAFNNAAGLLSLLGANAAQHFTVQADKPATITSKGGVQVKIPANAFVDQNGKAVSGAVDFTIEDILKPGAMSIQQVSTIANGRLLESGGMFKITAMQNGNELKVKEGAGMDVTMPATAGKKDMQLFVPQVNNQGITEWKVTPTAFALKPQKEIPLPYIQFDPDKLKNFKKETEDIPDINLQLQYQPLTRPVKPSRPFMPYKIYPVTRSSEFKWYEYFYVSVRTMDESVAAENKRRAALNDKNLQRYERSMKRYTQLLAQYKEDSLRFENEYANEFQCWLDDRQAEISYLKNALEVYLYNKGLDKLNQASLNKQLTQINPQATFIKFCSAGGALYYKGISLNRSLSNIGVLKNLSLTEAVKYFGDRKGRININYKSAVTYVERNAYLNEIALAEVNINPALRTMFNKAEAEIYEKRIAAGIYSITDLQQVYATTLPQTGMYNCDRFSDVSPKLLANIKIKANADTRISFYVPDINSFIYAYYDNKEKHSLKLPIGKEVIMVVLAINDNGEPAFEQRKLKVEENMVLQTNPQVASISQIRLALENI